MCNVTIIIIVIIIIISQLLSRPWALAGRGKEGGGTCLLEML